MTNIAAATPATFEKNLPVPANDELGRECEEFASSIFWPVLLTLIAVFVAESIFYVFWKYYWIIRYGKHLVLVTDVKKGDTQFAFDNPGFREGTPLTKSKKLSADTKENADGEQKITNGHRPQMQLDVKATNTSNSVATEQETNVVSLRGRDFTGLGFSICGNKRDGIFIRDVSHHGPASETGRIKAGDRILAVRINFNENMDLKDATDILCTASPYKIEIEIEDSSQLSNSLKNSDGGGGGGANNTSTNIVHTFFRSSTQQIQKLIPRKLDSEIRATSKNDSPIIMTRPAILHVSQVCAKTSPHGVKVLPEPDIETHCHATTILNNVSLPLVNIEKQQKFHESYNDSGIDVRIERPNSLDEVDLSFSSHSLSIKDESLFSPPIAPKEQHSVKQTLVKGIQNFKEKLNDRMQKSHNNENKLTVKNINRKADATISDTSKSNNYKSQIRMAESTNDAKNCVANCSKYVSLDSNDSDPSGKKHSAKPRAPLPPPKHRTLELSEMMKNDRNGENNDDNRFLSNIKDEANENQNDAVYLEADSNIKSAATKSDLSYVVVHHVASDDLSNRKANSLSDLSKMDKPVESTASLGPPLQRAVSLELTENPAPKICRIDDHKKQKPSLLLHGEGSSMNGLEATLFDREFEFETNSYSKLKKSRLFGTLEEAVGKDDSRT